MRNGQNSLCGPWSWFLERSPCHLVMVVYIPLKGVHDHPYQPQAPGCFDDGTPGFKQQSKLTATISNNDDGLAAVVHKHFMRGFVAPGFFLPTADSGLTLCYVSCSKHVWVMVMILLETLTLSIASNCPTKALF